MYEKKLYDIKNFFLLCKMDKIRVVNFGRYLAGPLTARYLRQIGATIITIKPPKSHPKYLEEIEWNEEVVQELMIDHTVYYLEIQQNKEFIFDIIRTSDVLIENFSAGTMSKFGLDYDTCKKINNRLVYVSMPAFYSLDTEYRHVKGWESAILAIAGIFKDMGLNRKLMGINASYSPLPLASVYASVFAAFSVVCKLFHLKRSSSCETYIEIPLASALAEALAHNSLECTCPYSYLSERQRHILNNDDIVNYEDLDDLMDPFYSHYVCRDETLLYIVAPCHEKHQVLVLRSLNLSEELQHIPHADPYNTSTQKKYGIGGNQTGVTGKDIKKQIAQKLQDKTAFEWEIILGEQGVPCCAHRSFVDWLQSDHAQTSHLAQITENGYVRISPLVWMKEEHILDKTIEYFQCDTTPSHCLSGIRVLDCSNVIAGPTIGRMLARAGADVVKIDNVDPSYAPLITILYGIHANQGKQSVLLDLKNDHATFKNLLVDVDVIIINTTKMRLDNLQLSATYLRSVKPSIVLVHFDAWGGPEKGRMDEYTGYDDNIQAAQGIMERFGGSMQTSEEHAHVGTIDVIAGVAGAYACVNSLYNILVHKKSYVARTSLSSVAQYVQFPFSCGRIENLVQKARNNIYKLGTACRGEHILHRCYEAADGYFMFIASITFKTNVLHDVLKTLTRLDVPIVHAEQYLVETFKIRPISFWIKRFTSKLQIIPLNSMKTVREKHICFTMQPNGGTFQFITQDSEIGSFTMVGNIAIRSKHFLYTLSNAPKYGEHSFNILGKNVHWSDSYMPYLDECPVCCEKIGKPFYLNCNHIICVKCATKCHLQGLNKCPYCCSEQSMCEKEVIQNAENYKASYSNWRQGKSKGARDMHRIRKAKSFTSLHI
jgi:crotonobetainyl-CoA:carnitine CoA-transferase CaiB-like acyl-CoA transferase